VMIDVPPSSVLRFH